MELSAPVSEAFVLEPDAEEEERERLCTWMPQFIRRPELVLPRPPELALRVYELAKQPDVDIGTLASMLTRDPLLAGRVLRLANSPMYRGAEPSTTLRQALTRVGFAATRELVMDIALRMTVVRAPGFEQALESVRRHSSGVAWVARRLAKHTRIAPDEAFVMGLMHDLGLSVGLAALSEFLRSRGERPVLTSARWLVIDQYHELIGRSVLEAWRMTPALIERVGRHHAHLGGRNVDECTATLGVAEGLAAALGWSVSPDVVGDDMAFAYGRESPTADELNRSIRALGLTHEQIAQVREDVKPTLEALDSYFR